MIFTRNTKAYYEDRDKVTDNRDALLHFPLEVSVKYMANYRAHWHKDIELSLICSGSLLVGINADSQVLGAGEMAFVNSGDIHSYECPSSDLKLLVIVFNPSIIGNLSSLYNFSLKNPFISQELLKQLKVPDSIQERIRNCFYEILAEVEQHQDNYEIMVRGILMELVALILRHVPYEERSVGVSNQGLKVKKIVQEAILYVEQNYASDLSIDELASHLGISEYYFSRIFNRMIGQTFRTYLNNLRLEKALKMLASSNLSITEIAYECGFGSLRTFNRIFKDSKHLAPTKYR